MTTSILLIVIYISFIGLGLPDSIFGSCWPSIRSDFSLPVYFGSYISFLTAFFTFLSSMFSPKIIKKLGTGGITFISTLLTAIGLLGFSFSNRFIFMLLLTIPLGFGAGAIDSALNNYVATHYKASHMSFLHCFYGIGVFISPIIMSIALKNTNWHKGYLYVSIVQLIITFISLLSMPLWKKNEKLEEFKKSNGMKEVLKIKPVKIGLFIFVSSCSVEFVCGNWGTTYLVNIKGLTTSISALSLGIYYFGMTLGRLTSGLVAKRLHSIKIIEYGFIFVLIGIITLILPLPYYIAVIGLFLIGFGNGPVFPNMTHLTPILYGKENSPSIISLQMGFCYIGTTIVPFIFGYIAQKYLAIFPYFLLFFFLITVTTFLLLKKSLKKENLL